MKCGNCLYRDNCSLKDLEKDLTGCEGHSKERPPREGEVKCKCCGQWVSKYKTFTDINGQNPICFTCW